VRARDEEEFRSFVRDRLAGLRRSAYLLCGDPHTADDIVSTTLAKLLRHWGRVSRLDHPDSYLRRMLVRTYLDERRRPWRRREYANGEVPDTPNLDAPDAGTVDRVTLLRLLDRLPPRRRAVLVLRFYLDLGVEQTAEVLGCAPGTVKAHTHQGLAALRAMLREPVPARTTTEES
jgi:RNA polymerase sigma-70 factor (sigma-E family)